MWLRAKHLKIFILINSLLRTYYVPPTGMDTIED